MSVKYKKWSCPNCGKRFSRHCNSQVHIGIIHHGMGQPIEEDKSSDGNNSFFSGLNKHDNDNTSRSTLPHLKDHNPSHSRDNFRTKSHRDQRVGDVIDEFYQMVMETKEKRKKIEEITNFFSQFSSPDIIPAKGEPSNIHIRNIIEPPLPPSIAPHQKKRGFLLSTESNTINDDRDKIIGSNAVNKKRPTELTNFNEEMKQWSDEPRFSIGDEDDNDNASSNEKWVIKRDMYGDLLDAYKIIKDPLVEY